MRSQNFSSEQPTEKRVSFCEMYPVTSVVDPFDRDSLAVCGERMAVMGTKYQALGDDLFMT